MNQTKLTTFLKSQTQPIAFVLGGGINGLGSIRSLGRRKIPVVYLDHAPHRVNFFSKYCAGLQCPNPLHNEDAFIEFLMALGRTLNEKPVLIPAADLYLLLISRHKKMIEETSLVPLSDYSVIEKVVRKRQFFSLLETMAIDHPPTYYPTTPAELAEVGDRMTYPCIVKPSFSFPFGEEFGCKLFVVPNKNALIQTYTKTSSEGYEMIIQDRIPGDDSTIFHAMGYLDAQSVPLGIFTFQKLRQAPQIMAVVASIKGYGCLTLPTPVSIFCRKLVTTGHLGQNISGMSAMGNTNSSRLMRGLNGRIVLRHGVELILPRYYIVMQWETLIDLLLKGMV